jgi:formamidopyrimidine-DNA glycosylase
MFCKIFPDAQLARRLEGHRFENSHRHGKHLFVRAGDKLCLRLHFGMTGDLQYFKSDDEAPKTTRVSFSFQEQPAVGVR